MNAFVAIVGAVALIVWLYLFAFHARFWSVRDSLAGDREPSRAARVVAVVPARNEADVIARTVTSLLEQEDLEHVVVVDDHSSDDTGQIAADAARAVGRASRLTVISGAELPPGWSGKVWAMRQGVQTALQRPSVAPDYLLFTDADIVHERESVATLVALAQERRADLVSLMAKLHCESVAERLLIPAFVFFFLMLYPPRWIRSRRVPVAGAAGGCILVTPAALERAGGLEAIRNEIIDDCALAMAVKRSGGTVQLYLAELVRSERPYTTREIGRMISRTAFKQLWHSVLLLAGTFVGFVAVCLAPPLLLFLATDWARWFGGVAWLLMAICYLPMVRFYRLSPFWALSLPISSIFYMGATVHSAVNYWRGAGGQWKGRVQDPAVNARAKNEA